MKILVICQHYYPEPFRITDICEKLAADGNDVTVITGMPNYPAGYIYEGYKNKDKKDETINGVKVHRCFTIGRRKGIFWRFLNYYSFCFSSSRYVKKLREEFDVVFVNQLSPIMMANAGVLYKKKRGTKLALYCMDLWPESLTVGGIKKGSFIYKHYHKVSKRIYRKADVLMVTSKTFKQYLMKEFGVKEETIVYMPQYAEAMFSAENCKKEKSETVDLLFAGNIGAAQSMETIIHTANRTKDIENLRWHIVGDGSELENCKKLVEKFNLSTVLFYGRKPLEEMPSFYQKADAMLVTLVKGSFVSLTLPGKVQTYMAAGKPILGAIDGETAEIIAEAKCGYCGPAEDVDSLEKNVRAFYQDVKGEREKVLGENSLKYYRQNFTQEKFFEILMKELSMN